MEALREAIDAEEVVPQLLGHPLDRLVLTGKSMCQLCEVISDYKNIHGLVVIVFS